MTRLVLTGVSLVLLVFGATALSGCGVDEDALLLEVTVDAYVQTIEVETRLLQADGFFDEQSKTIDRDAADIAGDPMRIAISLTAPGTVAVRIATRGVDGDVSHRALRCYQVQGIVRDAFALADTAVADADGDGWTGDLAAGCGEPCNDFACPAEFADCDDGAFGTNPGIHEDCGPDVNCNPDDDVACADVDGDGYQACPVGQSNLDCDCDDTDETVNPGVVEDCGAMRDLNCDRIVGGLCDNDGDTFFEDVDCDDDDAAINPSIIESPAYCNGIDDNCDRVVDEGCPSEDIDGDGVLPEDGDCAPCESGVHPGAPEACGDGIDQNCSMEDMACAAGDEDGDGDLSLSVGGRDCDDTDAEVYPGAPERCAPLAAGVDDDCDGMVDEGCMSLDADGDGYVEVGVLAACEGDASRNPGAVEVCDAVDQDCDGLVDEGSAAPGTACLRVDDTTNAPVFFDTDMDHCGGCAMQCNEPGQAVADQCIGGVCGCRDEGGAVCAVGENCCQGMGSAGGCHDLSESFDACGDCNVGCDGATASQCVGGTCRCGVGNACPGSEHCCGRGDGGACVDFQVDPNNCGECGARCGADETCVAGLCTCFGESATAIGREACTGNQSICCPRHGRCATNC